MRCSVPIFPTHVQPVTVTAMQKMVKQREDTTIEADLSQGTSLGIMPLVEARVRCSCHR